LSCVRSQNKVFTNVRPCERRFFPKFLFSRVSESDFFYFGNILVMSEPSELVPTWKPTRKSQKIVKNCFFVFFVFVSFGKGLLPKVTKKWCSTRPVSTHKNSSRLENQLESSVKSSECRALHKWLWRSQSLAHCVAVTTFENVQIASLSSTS
jgi:hypothetical protein